MAPAWRDTMPGSSADPAEQLFPGFVPLATPAPRRSGSASAVPATRRSPGSVPAARPLPTPAAHDAGPAPVTPSPGLPAALLGAFGIAGLALLLELLPRTGLVAAQHLPPLSVILSALALEAADPVFWFSLYETLRGWAIGLAVAVGAGLVLGIPIGLLARARLATASTIEFLRPIPSVALVPLAVLLFGTDLMATLLLVVYAAFWQVLVQVIAGVRDIDPVAADTARVFRLGPLARLRHVIWPSALPYVLTGVRLGATVALVLAVTGELVIGSPGLGKQIAVAQSSGAVASMYALILVTGLIGMAVNLGFTALGRKVLAWHPTVRGDLLR
ncbi:ABC-type nitrate/sulfonate/bicarbonate transport system permease component [Crossiella equi]|uniref:ABC-type nitrate/sulfonate/bicarbonate transport system permease component n=1 Tax=Crossiella equi TaxID=130796 RepID=A0ABS5AR29_9PSEU|nr:ABC transporter permease subunit [Crossiella equi]MBP2479013.1 ABC-type nitrate/sulfonate/bicarbonate transport system permease component [Crossiella equi]